MPRYDFECRSCNEVAEIVLPFDHDKEVRCGHCGNFLFKIFQPNAIHFKGNGWGGKNVR